MYCAELWPRVLKDITQGKNLFREVLARVIETVSTGPVCCLLDIFNESVGPFDFVQLDCQVDLYA